jgi:tritrans,polycis-undecaprenyl-diphosphate synthase [geranylgeranyl-diphosphate specific]
MADAACGGLSRLPRHVAIVPDGNRRWARARGLPGWRGHEEGYRVAKRVLNALWGLGVHYVTFYALSWENCTRRPREELERIYLLLSAAVEELLGDGRVREGRVRLFFAGDLGLLPGWLRDRILGANEATRGNGPDVLTVAVCYSGLWELAEALRQAAKEGLPGGGGPGLSWARRLLPLGWLPEPDLLIRTGGEKRLSGFLLPHLSYTELYFAETLWPDFGEEELCRALRDFQSRQRRFGR